MDLLVCRHVAREHLGLLSSSLERFHLKFQYVDLHENQVQVSMDPYRGLIVLGGPQSANDPFAFVNQEIQLIEQALRKDKPILGICLGSQLLAKALGAPVYANAQREIGWFPVTATQAAADDALLGDLRHEIVFHWHQETFDLPAGAAWLAYSEACRHQAFRYNRAWGLQFHLEVTPEMITTWCAEDEACGDASELDRPIDPKHRETEMRALAERVFDRWAKQVLLS